MARPRLDWVSWMLCITHVVMCSLQYEPVRYLFQTAFAETLVEKGGLCLDLVAAMLSRINRNSVLCMNQFRTFFKQLRRKIW